MNMLMVALTRGGAPVFVDPTAIEALVGEPETRGGHTVRRADGSPHIQSTLIHLSSSDAIRVDQTPEQIIDATNAAIDLLIEPQEAPDAE